MPPGFHSSETGKLFTMAIGPNLRSLGRTLLTWIYTGFLIFYPTENTNINYQNNVKSIAGLVILITAS